MWCVRKDEGGGRAVRPRPSVRPSASRRARLYLQIDTLCRCFCIDNPTQLPLQQRRHHRENTTNPKDDRRVFVHIITFSSRETHERHDEQTLAKMSVVVSADV